MDTLEAIGKISVEFMVDMGWEKLMMMENIS